jgi:ribonuclease HI
MQKKSKFYAVRAGRKIGIFSSWDECKALVTGFPGAEFKSFKDENSAVNYLNGVPTLPPAEAGGLAAFVDGSYRDGLYSYGCVIRLDGETVAELSGADDKYTESRNVAGEILGAESAVKWGIENGHPAITIYYDYSGVEKWASAEWKANAPVSRKYKEFMDKAAERISITFKKVTAHSGDTFNELADKIARSALPPPDDGYAV